MNNDQEKLTHRLTQAAPMLAVIAQEVSFTKAAEILGVQQSAVSHRVRSLEKALGLSLFERTTRQLKPTPAGDIVCKAAVQAVALWPQALKQLEQLNISQQVRLSVSSSLAMKWLIPLLAHRSHDDVDVALTVQDDHADFASGMVDAAIRYGAGPYPGLHAVRLCHSQLQPVANPSLAASIKHIKDLADDALELLEDRRGKDDGTGFNWREYFMHLDTAYSTKQHRYQFDRADLMLQGAINGMGIGLGRTLLIEQDLNAGFIETVGPAVKLQTGYWLVCPASFAQTDRYRDLLRWLKAQIKATLTPQPSV